MQQREAPPAAGGSAPQQQPGESSSGSGDAATSAAKLVAEIVASPVFYLVAGEQLLVLALRTPLIKHRAERWQGLLAALNVKAAGADLNLKSVQAPNLTPAAPQSPQQASSRSSWSPPPGSSRSASSYSR